MKTRIYAAPAVKGLLYPSNIILILKREINIQFAILGCILIQIVYVSIFYRFEIVGRGSETLF